MLSERQMQSSYLFTPLPLRLLEICSATIVR